MANGMTFNSAASTTYYLTYAVPRIPILPERRPATAEVVGRDGTIDFGNDSYAPRIIPVDCLLKAASEADLKTYLNNIAKWLSGAGWLIFDHDTTKRWDAKLYQGIEQNFIPKASQFTVMFEVQPYAEDVNETTGTIITAQDYGSGIEFYPTIEITMTSVATSLKVTLGSTAEFVTVTDSIANNDVIKFYMGSGLVTKNAVACMSKVSILSLFFDVPTGTQTISVTTDGTYTAAIKYRKRYLYA